MASRLIRCVAFVLAALMIGAGPGQSARAAQRQPDRIVAVGDLHGDLQAWQAIAREAGLTDPDGHWAGGRTTLVQLGDISDRGPATLQIVRHLQKLQGEARAAGGQVIVVLGNHEAMNLLGDTRYTTRQEFAAFIGAGSVGRREDYFNANRGTIIAAERAANARLSDEEARLAWLAKTPLGWVEHGLAWGPGGEIGRWASANPAIVQLGPYVFAHGGISRETAAKSIDKVNRRIAQAMAARTDGTPSPLNDPLGPLWYRGNLGRDADAEAVRSSDRRYREYSAEDELKSVLSAYRAKHLVIGHTPNPKGIVIRYAGKLAAIDTGISRHYGGTLSWLEIVGETMTPHVVKRPPP